jgi:HemY protein
MIRVLLFLVLVAALAFGAVWLAERPGDVAIEWLGYRIETSVMVLAAALAAIVVGAILLSSILRGLIRAPGNLSRRRAARRAERGRRALTRGLVAIGAGDPQAARRFALEARRFAPNEPLALLLGAQAAQLSGDRTAADQTFRAMLAREETKLLGLHGLFIEAQRRDDPAVARAHAEEAAKAAPALAWAAQAVLEFRCAEGDWEGALAAVESNMRSGLIDKAAYKRQRAVLLTGRALSRETDRDTAKALVLEAVKLCPSLVPAAALAGRFLAEGGEGRKAARVLEAAWAANPHPDLAEVYARLHPGDSARERLARMRTLARLSDHPESAIAVARAAIDAQEFAVARETLAPLLTAPTQRIATLMAELEEGESGNVGRAREWMARALHAGRDPAWTADGVVSDKWLPVSPRSGRLDAFQWKIPVADLTPPGPVIEHNAPAAPPAPPVPVAVQPAEAEPAAPPAPPPRLAAESRPVARPADNVIPLVHAPDDPGPEAEREAEPVEEPQSEGWRRLRSFFR